MKFQGGRSEDSNYAVSAMFVHLVALALGAVLVEAQASLRER